MNIFTCVKIAQRREVTWRNGTTSWRHNIAHIWVSCSPFRVAPRPIVLKIRTVHAQRMMRHAQPAPPCAGPQQTTQPVRSTPLSTMTHNRTASQLACECPSLLVHDARALHVLPILFCVPNRFYRHDRHDGWLFNDAVTVQTVQTV
jgi:hypothetical protein